MAAKVKWPNDVWANGKKMAGILTNSNGTTGGVTGFGVNVNQDMRADDALSGIATSICSETGGQVAREPLLAAICGHIERLMAKPYAEVLEEYKQHDMLVGLTIRVHHKSREEADDKDFDAEVLGFTGEGYLQVRNAANGEVKALSGEEVSITPQLAA